MPGQHIAPVSDVRMDVRVDVGVDVRMDGCILTTFAQIRVKPNSFRFFFKKKKGPVQKKRPAKKYPAGKKKKSPRENKLCPYFCHHI